MIVNSERTPGPVVIASAQRSVAEALAYCLKDGFNISTLTAGSQAELAHQLGARRQAGLVVVDLDFWKTADQAEEIAQEVPVAIISERVVPEISRAVLDGKLRGAVSKKTPLPKLAAAISLMLSGDHYLQDESRAETPEDCMADWVAMLSPRRLSILSLVAAGYSNRRIASDLALSSSLVAFELRMMFQRFGVRNRTELVIKWQGFETP